MAILTAQKLEVPLPADLSVPEKKSSAKGPQIRHARAECRSRHSGRAGPRDFGRVCPRQLGQ
eukprot:12711606-Alexandrium_andersonii.AAC.1